MTAYWVARAKINDTVEYKRYADQVPAIIEKFGGRILARGGRFEVLEGTAATACHESPDYVRAAQFRSNGVGENELVIVEGIS
jgi:uncharacterized protein (DUF1330 family)